MYMLAALRAVQGLGAGCLFTLVLAIIGDIVSPRERAKYTGYFMAVFATSSVLGPRMSSTPAHPFKVGFADSMSLVLLCGGSVMILAFLILLLMPAVELRKTSASAAARADQAEADAAAAPVPDA